MGSGLLTPGHLIIVLVIALIVFGPKRLPELGRSLGSGIRDFKNAIDSDHDEPETIEKPTDAQHDAPAAGATAEVPKKEPAATAQP
jgi:sec-independent protein translocase protein TatA